MAEIFADFAGRESLDKITAYVSEAEYWFPMITYPMTPQDDRNKDSVRLLSI
jgi:hypothetical protein